MGNERKTAVPGYPDAESYLVAKGHKDRYEPADIYPRDGNRELAALEAQVAELVGVPDSELLLYNTGMAAITDALDTADYSHTNGPTTILYGDGMYTQTTRFIKRDLEGKRGARGVKVNSGDTDAIRRALEEHQPDIIALETITNGAQMPVLDLEAFHRLLEDYPKDPLVILDNSIPSPSVITPDELLGDAVGRIIVAESGTKFYSLNEDMSGIAYTRNPQLRQELREYRRTRGSLLPPSGVERTGHIILPTKEEFDRRNRTIAHNTFHLAVAANEVADEARLFIGYPNLPGHPNAIYASEHFPDGAAPIFFIGVWGDKDFLKVATALEEQIEPRLREFGQSFGFERTRILLDPDTNLIRISGGTEDYYDHERLKEGFQRALTSI